MVTTGVVEKRPTQLRLHLGGGLGAPKEQHIKWDKSFGGVAQCNV